MKSFIPRLVVLSSVLLLNSGCRQNEESNASGNDSQDSSRIERRPLRAKSNSEAGTLFTPLSPEESGINPKYVHRADHAFAEMKDSGMEAGGIAIGDVDGDGLPDVFLASSPGNNRLYRQVSPLKFEDITPGSGLDKDDSWSRGASLIDIDNDGDLDLYVAHYGAKNELFLNEGIQGGKVRFVESAKRFGLDIHDASLMPAFCDYDHDGDLDLYLMSNQYHWPKSMKVPTTAEMIENKNGEPVVKHPYNKFYRVSDFKKAENGGMQIKTDRTGRPNYLFRNEGGRFKDVTVEVGMKPGHGRGLSPTWWDFDDDGDLDLYIANDWGDRDFLYRNNGDGTFDDVIAEAVPYTSMFTMGADSGDLNNDGRIDFIAADMSGTTHYKRKISMGSMQADQIEFMAAARPPQNMRNAVYLNTGGERVMESAYLMGLANSDWSWALKIADFDNDGWNDVFVTNGMEQNIREIEEAGTDQEGKELRKEDNLAFRNKGDLHFEECGKDWGLNHFGYSLAAANCDFDRDGDLDLLVIHRDEMPMLYQNNSKKSGVLIELRGGESNRFGVGGVVRIKTKSGEQVRQIMPTRGYLTSDELMAHFGLNEGESILELEVTWPGGAREVFRDLPAQHHYLVSEPGSVDKGDSSPDDPPALFKPIDGLESFVHQEVPYDDFAVQPLLPNKLSQLGPGMAVGDLDGDGDEDFVLGGAKGSKTQVALNDGTGQYSASAELDGSDEFEDMGLLLFDADADGDRDLYVVSGGVESTGALLQDRLYLNDGKGAFSIASGKIPPNQDSGGPVACADVDRDGDLDVFVGGRVVPGEYPISAKSRLLLNNGGVFTNAEIPGDLGMVTGAVFSDIDNDDWVDLVISREWGPIEILRNENGQFVRTSSTGLDEFSGWWNGIASADLDGDGDLDLVATNFGKNTKYHASSEKPAQLYYGSFGTDSMRLVETEYEGGQLLPIRGKSCSTAAIPHLADKFKTFHSFALADVATIYSKPVLEESQKFSASTLSTGVFLNDGTGKFNFAPLPRLAQIAPSFGIGIADFDGDGIQDLCLSQNFFTPQIETGRMSGGLGLFLRGNGDGSFESVWPKESGISLPLDMTALCLTDANLDGRPDFLIASNDGPVRGFLNHSGADMVRVVLEGQEANPDAFGARITAELKDGSKQVREIHGGQGYLGQSGAASFFSGDIKEFSVRWPEGDTSVHSPQAGAPTIVISKD